MKKDIIDIVFIHRPKLFLRITKIKFYMSLVKISAVYLNKKLKKLRFYGWKDILNYRVAFLLRVIQIIQYNTKRVS